MNDVT